MRLEYVIVSLAIFLVILAAVLGMHANVLATFFEAMDKFSP